MSPLGSNTLMQSREAPSLARVKLRENPTTCNFLAVGEGLQVCLRPADALYGLLLICKCHKDAPAI